MNFKNCSRCGDIPEFPAWNEYGYEVLCSACHAGFVAAEARLSNPECHKDGCHTQAIRIDLWPDLESPICHKHYTSLPVHLRKKREANAPKPAGVMKAENEEIARRNRIRPIFTIISAEEAGEMVAKQYEQFLSQREVDGNES